MGAVVVALLGSAVAFAQPADQEARDPTAPQRSDESPLPASREALFGDEEEGKPGKADDQDLTRASSWKGYLQGEAARTYREPAHWSKLRLRADLNRSGRLSDRVKWKIGARFDYDAAYDLYDFYRGDVRRDQRSDFMLRENYLDVAATDWEFRLGRQHVVWGEMVGLFFADVVSARDLREFLLPEFEALRIPQWAARAEYFRNEVHAELLWVPVPSYDRIGKPGADFYPYPLPPTPGHAFVIRDEVRPDRKLSNSNYGFRLSTLRNGWDLSAFFYRSLDISPTFFRQVVTTPVPAVVYQPRHVRISQFGGTLSKDLGSFVLRGEAVVTRGRYFNVTRLGDSDGLSQENTLDYAVGLDFPLEHDGRINIQFFQRVFSNHDPDTVFDRRESGASVLLSRKFAGAWEAQGLVIHSLNRSDWMFRPRLTWEFERNWRLAFGLDVFHGPQTGFFGRFDNADRVYSEIRYDF